MSIKRVSFLVMGVAAFLAPRFLGCPSKQSLPDSRTPSSAWKKQAGLAAIAALAILAGAVLQAAGLVRFGAIVVAVAVTAYILYQIPLLHRPKNRSWLTQGLRVALFCTMAAPWARALFPEARLASAHILLVGGFGLLTLIIGTRGTFGHSGYAHLFQARLPSMAVLMALYLLALTTRLAGEFIPALWHPLLITSALLLLVAHLLWGAIAVPKLLAPKPL